MLVSIPNRFIFLNNQLLCLLQLCQGIHQSWLLLLVKDANKDVNGVTSNKDKFATGIAPDINCLY